MSVDLERAIVREINDLCPIHTQLLSTRAQKILDLYNEEEEIKLETAFLEAQNHLAEVHVSDAELQEQLQNAERDVIEARASYTLRNKIIQDTLITDPILKAVHASSYATKLERDLFPLVNARDSLSMLHSYLATNLDEMHAKLFEVERSNMVAIHKNKDLTQELMELVQQTQPKATTEVSDLQQQAQLTYLEREIKPLKRRWRVMKSLLTGTIVGSGVDWARDATLQDLVLDDEDEMV